MDIISKDDLENAPELKVNITPSLIDSNLPAIIPKLDNPVELQQEVTAQVYLSLQKRMSDEMKKFGFLSDTTRQWIQQFNSMCDSLQKNKFGDKSVQINIHKISHSQVAAHIRKFASQPIEITPKEIKDAEVDSDGNAPG